MSSPIDGGYVLVTGASSGIGLELARQMAPRVKALVLVARRKERMDALASELVAAHEGLVVHVLDCDLSSRSATESLLDRIDAVVPRVDVLVNNAGVGDMGVFERSDIGKQLAMLELNVASVLLLTRRFLPGMVARGRGAVLNISSGFGVAYLPGFAGYIGTKHFITGFTDALRAELSGTGVIACQVLPGPVATEFEQNVGNFTGEKVPSFIEISAERCARATISALDHRRAMKIPGIVIHGALLLASVSPRWLTRWVLALVGRLLRRRQDRARAVS